MFDLHMHSNISRDADYSPETLIEMAKEKGLKYVALSDHNDMAGIDRMINAGKKEGITVIPAIEFDTLFEGLEIHLLGYNLDYHKPYYKTLAKYINGLIDGATYERIQLLKKKYNVELDYEDIMKKANGENPFFHVFNEMINNKDNDHIKEFDPYRPGGKRSSPASVNFYWDNCSTGSDCYVEVKFPDFKETVERIHKDGGIAVLAHPWKNFYEREDLLLKAIEYGVDGIEAYSNYHEDYHNEFYDDFCKKHNLLMTCGSDFHGSLKPKIKMGEFGYKKDNLEEVLNDFLQYINNGEL